MGMLRTVDEKIEADLGGDLCEECLHDLGSHSESPKIGLM
jgi:hypothetical protein